LLGFQQAVDIAIQGAGQGSKPSQGTTGIGGSAALATVNEKTIADMINERDDQLE